MDDERQDPGELLLHPSTGEMGLGDYRNASPEEARALFLRARCALTVDPETGHLMVVSEGATMCLSCPQESLRCLGSGSDWPDGR